tara:strand:+ start:996 stop:1583 length:588 start_codon:yes stop_codon:yes gene_type:complete
MAPKRKLNKSPNTSPIKSVVKNSNAYSFSIESGNNDPYNGKRRKQTKIKNFLEKTIKKINNQGSAIREPTPQDRRENYHKKYGNQMINYSTSKRTLSPDEMKKIKELERKVAFLIELKKKKEANKKAKEEVKRKAKEEANRKAKIVRKQQRERKEEANRKAKEEAKRKAKEEANRKAKENNKIINRMINSFIKNK